MLFFATRLMKERLGEDFNLRKLHLLHQLQSGNEAKAVVSDEPCQSCKDFQKVIELVTELGNFQGRIISHQSTSSAMVVINLTKHVPRRKASTTANRKKRQYEDTDDQAEYTPTHQRRRLLSKSLPMPLNIKGTKGRIMSTSASTPKVYKM